MVKLRLILTTLLKLLGTAYEKFWYGSPRYLAIR